MSLINLAKGTLLTNSKLEILQDLVKESISLEGSLVECGVYRGGSSRIILNEIKNTKKHLFCFDTFTGIPDADPKKDIHKNGAFKASYEEVHKSLSEISENFSLIIGIIPHTLQCFTNQNKFCFLHVDTDTYKSHIEILKFFYPRIEKGIILFDDFGQHDCPGVALAINEFFSDKPEKVQKLKTQQAVVRKGF